MKAPSAAVLGLGALLRVSDAGACGAVETTVEPLLPLDGAEDIPTNVVLITSSQGIGAEYQLRRVSDSAYDPPNEPSDAMGGSPGALDELIPVEISCRKSGRASNASGAICFAHANLDANTQYEWAVRVVPDHAVEDPLDFGPWRRFSTGAGPSATNEMGNVSAEVTRYEVFEDPPCGDWSGGTILFDVSSLTEPVVANLAGLTPDYLTHAIVLEPGTAGIEMRVWNIEGCYAVELFDRSGARTPSGEVCFGKDDSAGSGGSGMPAAGGDGDGARPGGGAAREGGCSVGSNAPTSPWIIAVVLGVLPGAWARTIRRRRLLSKARIA